MMLRKVEIISNYRHTSFVIFTLHTILPRPLNETAFGLASTRAECTREICIQSFRNIFKWQDLLDVISL